MKKINTGVLISLLLLAPMIGIAETTRYVSDQLEITMRTGKGVKHSITKMLTSGTKLDILETDPTGYSKVRTGSGSEGWVLTRFLSGTGSARNRLVESEQKVANLELEIARYKQEIEAISSQSTNANSENLTLQETSQRLSRELDELRRTASNALALDNENRQLKEERSSMTHEMELLSLKNTSLEDSSAKRWFLIGAAVLFGGLLLGLIIPRLRFQKKNNWGSL